jgi:hypothetical protein
MRPGQQLADGRRMSRRPKLSQLILSVEQTFSLLGSKGGKAVASEADIQPAPLDQLPALVLPGISSLSKYRPFWQTGGPFLSVTYRW